MTVSALLRDESVAGQSRVQRARTRTSWRDPASGYLREEITAPPVADALAATGPVREDLALEIVRVRLPPGARIDFPPEAFVFIRQAVWVLAGSLRFIEGDTVHVLEPDSCLTLGAPAHCTFENATSEECVYVVTVARLGPVGGGASNA